MSSPLPRRIGRRTVLALGALVLLAGIMIVWGTTRDSRAIERSRAVRIGMRRAEVEEVLGAPTVILSTQSETGLLYGALGAKFHIGLLAESWFGIDRSDFDIDEWPVHVWLDLNNSRVIRIERAGEEKEQ